MTPEAPLALPRERQARPKVDRHQAQQRRFRPDIQGLRAVAVLLVVLYHAGLPGLSGGYVGVDVFFVISGFLITGQLLREIDRTGGISFTRFYAHRIRRLLPPAALVLVLTVVLARLTGSLLQFRSTALDTVLTAGYLFNYRLAEQGVNYQNLAGPQSPLQHFWSLAVEEQFYLLWPVLLVAAAAATRRHPRKHRLILITAGLIAVVVVSLGCSIVLTGSNAPLAYFSLQTRAWELAVGALVAIGVTRLSRLPAGIAVAAGWIGLTVILVTGSLYTENTPFPGSAALLPVLGAALLIAAGCRGETRSGSVETVLDRQPLQVIGKLSYGWYLWHWPVIVLAPRILDQFLTLPMKLALMLLALGLSALTYWLIEAPTRRSGWSDRRWLGLGLGLSGAVAGLAAVLLATMPALVGQGPSVQLPSLSQNSARGGGSTLLDQELEIADRTTVAPNNLTPALAAAAKDAPGTSHNGCHLDYLDTVQPDCVYGDPAGEKTVVLVGDSHAEQWFPALERAAEESGWRLISWTKAACSLAEVPLRSTALKREFTECLDWRQQITARILQTDPDLVISSQSNSIPDARTDNRAWGVGTVAALAGFQQAGIPVTYIGDTPNPQRNGPDCLADHLSDVERCSTPRSVAAPTHGRAEDLRQSLVEAGVTVIEPTNWICTATSCPALVGNLLVYRDGSHLSTSYSRYLAPLLGELLSA